jgi:hypothetical protein
LPVTDEDIDAEVARLFALHPELRARFREHGCPIDKPCSKE